MYFWLKPKQESDSRQLPLYAPPPLPPPHIDDVPPPPVRGFEEINFDIDEFYSENFVHTIIHDV